MISQDRIDLNDRFIKVFQLLEERGDIIKNDRGGKGMGDFAEKILGNRAYGHIVRAFLNPADKRVIDYHHARQLCREYGVNETFMVDGIGTPFGFDIPKRSTAEETDTMAGNILFTTGEAFAGASIDAGGFAREDYQFFAVPGVAGTGLVAFTIKGNSMEPVIQNGDIVICREVGSISEIRDNKIYAIKNNGSLWVKYVQRIPNSKGRIAKLKLISANHLDHAPFVEDVNEHTRIYEVIRRIVDIN